MSRRGAISGLIPAAALAMGGVAAPALAITSPDGGSTATKVGSVFKVRDAKCDGYGAYGNWGGTTANRLDNWSGCNTTAQKNVGTVGAYRACTNVPLAPDPCSVWKG